MQALGLLELSVQAQTIQQQLGMNCKVILFTLIYYIMFILTFILEPAG